MIVLFEVLGAAVLGVVIYQGLKALYLKLTGQEKNNERE